MTSNPQSDAEPGLAENWRRGSLLNPPWGGRFRAELDDRLKADSEISPLYASRNAMSAYQRTVQIWIEVERRAAENGVESRAALDQVFRDIRLRDLFDGPALLSDRFLGELRNRADAVLNAGRTWDEVPSAWEAVVMEYTFTRLPSLSERSQPDITDR